MRPRRLELEGFASFRERVEVDFADADLFAFCGPTGAGKSSLIDAITFALYGAVPRYGSQNLVWPVITQGMNEARVRLDFTVGLRRYTAVRVVRRTGATSATTKEARLEDDTGRVLAGNSAELTESAERLIGLPFTHFTRCVVLPQGEFAEFLQARPGDRQELLVKLLGLDVYQGIAQRANQRAADSANRAALLAEQLAGPLARATPEALTTARERVAALDALLDEVQSDAPELERLGVVMTRAAEEAEHAGFRIHSLGALRKPAGIERLARGVAAATRALREAEAALDAVVARRAAAERARDALPERSRLELALARRKAAADLRERVEAAEQAVAEAAEGVAKKNAVLAAAEDALRAADATLEDVAREHAAHHLAEQLRSGEPCPVCLQKVRKLPAHDPPADLERTRRERAEAQRQAETARAASARTAAHLAAATSERDGLRARIDTFDAELRDAPAVETAREQLAAIDVADAELREARSADEQARRAHRAARDDVARIEKERDQATRTFDQARDNLAALGLAPPPAQRQDLDEDWQALLEWAKGRLHEETATQRAAQARSADARAAWQARIETHAVRCRALDVEPGDDPRLACATARAHAAALAARIESDLATADRVREERTRLERDTVTARTLGRLLDARNFERWLMNRALRLLVAAATRVLRELSSGAYSLALDSKNEFLVIDHRNADEKRIARTLSGGESFLASLALALALAEHVADLASGGAARIEALFLDEGFGTLDAATLDTVAAAIEELGARGRMVGLITHVRELADRMPVRFEVRKIGGISCVEMVMA